MSENLVAKFAMIVSSLARGVSVSLTLLACPALAVFPDCRNGTLATNQVCSNTALDPWSRAAALVAEFTLAEKVANAGNTSPGVARIGLPAYEWWSEALHGVASSPGVGFAPAGQDFGYATSFPQPITLGATWDVGLVRGLAETISTEARAFSNANRGGLNYWTPNINPLRDPRWGRGQEVPSEDAFFIKQYVAQLIPGLQGGLTPSSSNPYLKVVATCKHFAGYDIEDWHGNERYGFDAVISPQDLRDYYLPPFEACARDAGAQSFMCSYNAVNGVPTCADPWLLGDLLRTHWNWTGSEQWVASDCDALRNVYSDHRYLNLSAPAAAAASLEAGTDLDCGTFWPEQLGPAYSSGLFNISTLDTSLIRRYASLVRLGYFDTPEGQAYRQLGWKDVAIPEAKNLAYRAAVEGVVLLKNQNNTLPLLKANVIIAVIGPMASATRQMQGNYYGVAQDLVSPARAFEAAGYTVLTSPGTNVTGSSPQTVAIALEMANRADVVVYVGGIDNSVETEAHDRETIAWPGVQLSLITTLSNIIKPLIVVQMGTMLDCSELKNSSAVDALIWAGYPGQDGGTAIVDVLTGVVAPAGRLAVTQYPQEYVDEIDMTDMSLKKVTSDFVVMFFLRGEYGPEPYPVKSLVAFERLKDIEPGASKDVFLNTTLANLARSDGDGNLVLWPGNYSLVLDIDDRAKWEFTIIGEPVVLDELPKRRRQ